MRILFHTYDLAFQRMGGGEQVMVSLAQALGRLGFEVAMHDPWIHRPEAFSIIHTFSCRQLEDWSFFRRRFPGVPLLVTPTLAVEQSSLRARFSDHFRSAYFREPTLFFPATRAEGVELQRRFAVPSSKIRVLPNGIEASLAGGDAALAWRSLGIAPTPMVLTVGRFEPVKNQLLLLRAMEKKGSGLCVLLGDPDPAHPEYFRECESFARAAEGRRPGLRFIFLSGVPARDPLLAALYAAAAVYVQPSRFETFGLAALEAYTAGCAMALSDRMAARELFDAQFFSPLDVQACANAILAQEGRARVPRPDLVEKHSWDSVAVALAEFYREASHGIASPG